MSPKPTGISNQLSDFTCKAAVESWKHPVIDISTDLSPTEFAALFRKVQQGSAGGQTTAEFDNLSDRNL
jgi:hypothetical protein